MSHISVQIDEGVEIHADYFISEGHIELKNISVITYIEGFDHDITAAYTTASTQSFKYRQFEKWTNKLYEAAREHNEDVA